MAKREPVKKKVTKKTTKKAAKKVTKKTPSKKKTSGRKKAPPLKDRTFEGVTEVTISEEMAERIRTVHAKLGGSAVETINALLEAGVTALESRASGNLIDEDTSGVEEDVDEFDSEFGDAFEEHINRVGT